MKINKYAFMALLLSSLLVFTACFSGSGADNTNKEMTEAKEDMNEMKQEKEMIVYTMDGKEVNLLNGERTYVKAWASWCSICLSGLGEIDELSASDTDFRVLTVVSPNNFGEKSKEDFMAWWAGLDYENIEVLMDLDGVFFKDIQMRAFPTSVYINSKGEYQNKILGHNANSLILETMMGIE